MVAFGRFVKVAAIVFDTRSSLISMTLSVGTTNYIGSVHIFVVTYFNAIFSIDNQ